MRHVAVAVLGIVGCAVGCGSLPEAPPQSPPRDLAVAPETPEPAVVPPAFASAAGLETARAELGSYVLEHARPGKYDEVVVSSLGGAVLTLEPPFTLDFEYGDGHGGTLGWLRFDVDAATTAVESISWRTTRRSVPPGGEVLRAVIPTQDVLPLVQLVRALADTKVERRPLDEHGTTVEIWGSSRDFFVLARAVDRHGNERLLREYAGYEGSLSQTTSVPIECVVRRARRLVESLESMERVPPDRWRATHLSDAFRRNAAFVTEKFHWWVLERSLLALESLGNLSALPTLLELRAHPTVSERASGRIERILADPARYLGGPSSESLRD